jgi:hypothetical protein
MRYFWLIVILLSLNSCLNFGGATYLNTKSNAVENEVVITTKQVHIAGPLRVVLTNSATSKAVMTQDLFELLEISVQDGVTLIKPVDKLRPFGFGLFEIHLGIKNLDTVTVSTDRSITSLEPLTGNAFTFNLNSAVTGSVNSRIRNLTVNVASVEPLELIGTADTLTLTTNGFARVRLKRFLALNEIIDTKTGSVIKQ